MKQLTKEEAIAMADNESWKTMSEVERAHFQMHQDKLCMPFAEFQRCMEIALGRPVWTHEFGLNRNGLMAEMAGQKGAPTLDEIMALIPAHKLTVVMA